MKIIDVHDELAHIYRVGAGSIQKATSFVQWNDVKKQLYTDTNATVLLMDESCFLRYHMTIRVTQSEPLTRSQYKALVSEKITELQSNYGIKPEQLTYIVKNMVVNKEPVEFVIGESGVISFDLCFFGLDTKRSDIVHLKHVRFYPRWYFMLNHPILSKKERMHLLVIDGTKSSLIRLENGRYKHMAQLNGGDDLLRQAYEQA